VLIDMLGFGIALPVLPGLIMTLEHVPISVAAEYAGWMGAGYAVMQFVFAPVIGNLSDRFGRRPVMLAAVLAMALDYWLQAMAPALWWLIIGRLVAGATGASFSAAYAYVADVTAPEKRAASFGLMGMAFGIGFVVGPALGGLLGSIDQRLPFKAAAVLALANFLFGLVFLEGIAAARKAPPVRLAPGQRARLVARATQAEHHGAVVRGGAGGLATGLYRLPVHLVLFRDCGLWVFDA